MYKHTLKIFCALILLSITSLQAQNYNDAIRLGFPGLGSNARALGMGNAFNALSDDASASYFNPAGFGLIKKMELSGGLSFNNFDNTTTLFENETQDNTTNTSLNRISFALPFPTYQGSLVFGLSYHQSKDLSSIVKFDGFNSGNNSKIQDLNVYTDIPFDLFLTDLNYNTIFNGNLNQSGNILNTGGIDNWTFSGAIEVEKNLFIGGNLTVINGSFESNNEFYEDDIDSLYQGIIAPDDSLSIDFLTFYLNNNLKWEIGGWNAKLGFLYQLEDIARFGVTVQFPKTFSINENFSVSGYSEFNTAFHELPQENYTDEVAYDITTPFELTGAFAVNFKGIIISAEANYIDYTQMKFSGAEGIDVNDIADMNKDIKDILTSALNYNLGFEYTVPTIGLRIRGGYMNQPSAFADDDSDFDHKYLTGGLGYLANGKIGIDIAYAYGWWKDIGDNYDVDVSRTYQDVKHSTVMLTTTYRF